MRHNFAASFFAMFTALATGVLAQDAPADVKPDHWAYTAVEDLAKKGLIKGYPPDGKFLGGRTLSRYEMATILKRILDRMDDIVHQQKPGEGVTKQDIDNLKASVGEIQQLVNEFKTQLTVIGTDMSRAKEDLTALKQQMGGLEARLGASNSRIDSLTGKVDAVTLKNDQLVRGISELKDALNTGLAKKVDVSVGKLRVAGLIQNWFVVPFGGTPGGNFGSAGNFSTPPPGRNFGGGVGDTFRLRRGEVALLGNITSKVDYRLMFDLAKTGTGAASPLQDMWVGYQLTPRLRVEVGAQKPDLTEEGNRSPALLLTVERSIMNELPANAGRSGTQRDTGAVLRYKAPAGYVSLGIWNDLGAAENGPDTDRFKFATLSAGYTGLRYVTLGFWSGTNVGDFRPRNIRDRAGVTLITHYRRSFAEAEFGWAQDRFNNGPLDRSLGGYALYAYSLSNRWQLVGRYDEWDPSVHGGIVGPGGPTVGRNRHNLREYTFGFNYYLRSHSAKIQVNYVIDDTQGNGISFFGVRRQLLLTNYQASWY